ncbi:ATP-dependent endopeptidase Lon [Borrelia duttonii CR2A]|uniref:ATP-dependent endopeptidase Lon n=1 Tax=Borrelia duttonii CR2A TaxID=1432657 RepID=W6TG00_9SPIR|nr:ATP-dependent endopeptidase Lon [Borrelia duttonii CR2A]ETZ19044.1 ATP-dependent endopeptidase Lon [Borrelia duttonii CR2A]
MLGQLEYLKKNGLIISNSKKIKKIPQKENKQPHHSHKNNILHKENKDSLKKEIKIGGKKFYIQNEYKNQLTFSLKEIKQLISKGLKNEEEKAIKNVLAKLTYENLIIFKNKKLIEIMRIVNGMEPNWTLLKTYENTNVNINEIDKIKNILECTMNFIQHSNKKSVLFLSLRSDYADNFWLKPQKSFIVAIEESMDSIKSLIDNQDNITKLASIKKTINKVYKKLNFFF